LGQLRGLAARTRRRQPVLHQQFPDLDPVGSRRSSPAIEPLRP
jgi:hypothetical protein